MLLWLPTINATLNGIAFFLLLSGYVAIRRRNVKLHMTLMLSAFAVSAAFPIPASAWDWSGCCNSSAGWATFAM